MLICSRLRASGRDRHYDQVVDDSGLGQRDGIVPPVATTLLGPAAV